MTEFLPWQQSILENLIQRKQQSRLPHALLFSGSMGIGKVQFAVAFAKALLCKQATAEGHACGVCASCKLFSAGTHPDFSSIHPEEVGKAIRIDQIRALSEHLSFKSHYGGYKVVVIRPADKMNRASANSLLKTLEEPSDETLIILVTDRPGYLLPTIRSRCQLVPFPKPDHNIALDWLQASLDTQTSAAELLDLAHGAPLRAFEMAGNKTLEKRQLFIDQLNSLLDGDQDPISISALWVKADTRTNLGWIASWVADMIKLKFVADSPLSINKDILYKLQVLAQKVELNDLFRYLDRLDNSARLAEGQINQQLLLEDALICWSRLFSRTRNLQRQ